MNGMKNTLTLLQQQETVERRALDVEKWTTLLQGTQTPTITAVASSFLSIPITNASLESVFSLMTAAWTDQWNWYSVELIKLKYESRTVLDTIKDFYTYALEEALLKAACSSKQYKVKKNIWDRKNFLKDIE